MFQARGEDPVFRRGEAELLAAKVAERQRVVEALESLLADRQKRLADLRLALTEERLRSLWLNSEVARRDERIGHLEAQAGGIASWKWVGRFFFPVAVRRLWVGRWLARLIRGGREGSVAVRPTPCSTSGQLVAPTPASVAATPDPETAAKAIASSPALANVSTPEAKASPWLSVLLVVGPEDPSGLVEAVASVYEQTDPTWELWVLEISGSQGGTSVHDQLNAVDGRIQILEVEGEAGVNAAAASARGEYLLLMGPDDRLVPDCARELRETIIAEGRPDLIYADDAVWDTMGRCGERRFKPGWSPEFLLATMYMGSVLLVRRDRFQAIGGYQDSLAGSAAHDLALRLAEGRARVAHVPRVLSHHRLPPPITPEGVERGARVVRESLERRGVMGEVARPEFAILAGLGLYEVDFAEKGPGVAILIPTRNQVDFLARCIASILDRTTYHDYRIVVIDNDSDDPAALAYLADLPRRDERCTVRRISNAGRPFNYARVNNHAVARLEGRDQFVLFLNNDTEVRRGEWMSQLVGYALLPGVGAAGARLLFPDGRVQHAGMILDCHERLPGHAFKLAPWWYGGHLNQALVARNCSALTAACLLTPRDLFLDLGGFDEERFAVAFNDVDYCLRLSERGLRCVYVPRAELLHFEGATRGFGDDPAELQSYLERWVGRRDAYVNPNLVAGGDRLGSTIVGV